MTRAVLVDDHSLFRDALRDLLRARLPDVEIVGEASNGAEAAARCRELQPDLLLLDLSMPDRGGLELLDELASICPGTRTVVVSQHSDRTFVMRALGAGARAYVPKKALANDLVRAIETVLSGGCYVDPSVAEVVVESAVQAWQEPAELRALTAREREILRLVAAGKTASEIGQTLSISPHAVNRHRANLMEKLGVRSKAELVRLAVRLGVIDP